MPHMKRFSQAILTALMLVALTIAALPATRASAANERWCPPESYGICSENAFLDFWRGNGALDILGYPIDPPRSTPEGMVFQVYERAILEWHPEFPPAYQVSLSRLGALLVEGSPQVKQRAAQPPAPCTPDCAYFEQTRHTLRGEFLNYWTSYGGLAVFGFPLTEQYEEVNAADGKTYLVQYFERNRFEFHPENQGKYRVLLGRLGAEFLTAQGSTIKSWPPASVPNYPLAGNDQALVDVAAGLVASVPEYRYIVETIAGRNVAWRFADLPEGVAGSYSLRSNLITYNSMFRVQDPHNLAAVMGHEGQHAFDVLTFGPPRTENECYELELRGFATGAALWKAWYGPAGKPSPVNDFERFQNAVVADFETNGGRRVIDFILRGYAEECGPLPKVADAELSPLFTVEGLPTVVTQTLPDLPAVLATLAGGVPPSAFGANELPGLAGE